MSVCVVCLTVLANCLLNAFDVCVGEVVVFYLNVFMLFFWLTCFCWLIHDVLSSKVCVCVCGLCL